MIKEVKAIVEKVFLHGPHGPYAIASTQALTGSITFSLERNVWQEQEHPDPGEVVFLYNLREKRQGWRAKKGRYWNPSDEQTANEEMIVKNLKVLMEKLKCKWFPTEDDKAWKQWVDFKSRETRDLITLLSSDVRDSFKRRAIFLLLTPSADFNPIYWKHDSVGKFYWEYDFLKSLTPDLMGYAADLVAEFIQKLRPFHQAEPKHFAQGGGGMTVYWSVPDKYHDALYFYNNCILIFLRTLSEEQGEKLCSLFSLNDISTFSNMEDASGYNPFKNLLYAEEISEKWKKMADKAMRRIILKELAGIAKPRKDWEDAMRCYADIVQTQLYSGPHYSVEMFAGQMEFIVNNRNPENCLINGYHIIKIFKLLSDDSYKYLRHQIARHAVLEDQKDFSRFSIYSDDTREAANLMLKEFGDSDQELAEKVQALIDEHERKKAENLAQHAKVEENEESILSAMK